MKKALALILSLILLAATLAGCAAKEAATAPDAQESSASTTSGDRVKIGLCLQNTLGDNGIADAQYAALEYAKSKCDFDFDYSELSDATEAEGYLREYVTSGEYDLIICATDFTYGDAIANVAPEYPNQKFLHWDAVETEYPNVATAKFYHEQTGFVAGVFAALMEERGEMTINGKTYTWTPGNVFASLGGTDVPETYNTLAGFWAGAKYINPDAELLYATVGSWADQAKCKELAISLYEQGANFAYCNVSAGYYGVVEAAKEMDKFTIGFDRENTLSIDADHVVAAALNDNVKAIGDVVIDFVENGTFNGGKNERVGYTTGHQSFEYQQGLEVPEDVKAIVDDVIAKVSGGEITVPYTFDDVASFNLVYER